MARKMKDSGIEWIGEIPEGWEIHRMKSCISQRDGGAWGDEATGETGDCICLRIADFDYEHFRFIDSNNLTIRHYASPIIRKLLLQKNDILIEKSGGGEKTPVGRTVLFDKEYPALFANFMDRLRCSDFILPQYLQYVFVTFYKNRYTQNYIKQTTGIQNLDLSSMLADEFVPVPNLNEQKLIVCYLESKCSKIDNLLSKTRSSIEEYKKLKQAVITQAVTKGVRGEREIKESKLPWASKIPKAWNICAIRHIMFECKERTKDGHEEQLSVTQQFGIIKSSDASIANPSLSFDDWRIVAIGDIVFNKYKAHSGVFFVSPFSGIVTFNYSVYRCFPNCYAKYFEYQYKTHGCISEFRTRMHGVGNSISPLYTKDLMKIKVVCPPLDEQKEIANYLDAKCAEIDKLIAKKEQLVKELESYKKSLIYEVVTGKREV